MSNRTKYTWKCDTGKTTACMGATWTASVQLSHSLSGFRSYSGRIPVILSGKSTRVGAAHFQHYSRVSIL